MTSLNRRGRLQVKMRDDFEVIAVNVILETKQRHEGDESLEWNDTEPASVTVFQMRTTLLIALLGLIVTGMTLFM